MFLRGDFDYHACVLRNSKREQNKKGASFVSNVFKRRHLGPGVVTMTVIPGVSKWFTVQGQPWQKVKTLLEK
jgi:hypothetical protein